MSHATKKVYLSGIRESKVGRDLSSIRTIILSLYGRESIASTCGQQMKAIIARIWTIRVIVAQDCKPIGMQIQTYDQKINVFENDKCKCTKIIVKSILLCKKNVRNYYNMIDWR